MPLTAANYTAAIDLLTLHYGSTEVIIQENFRYLHNLPVVPPGNHSALKQFLISSEIRIISLESLGVPRESYTIPFVPFLVDRLPKNVRTAWYRFIAEKKDISEVEYVLAFLRKELVSQERSQDAGGMGRKRGATEESFDHLESKRAKLIPSASALTTLTKSEKKEIIKTNAVFVEQLIPLLNFKANCLYKRGMRWLEKKDCVLFAYERVIRQLIAVIQTPTAEDVISAIIPPYVENRAEKKKGMLIIGLLPQRVAVLLLVLVLFPRSKISILRLQLSFFMAQRERQKSLASLMKGANAHMFPNQLPVN